MNYVVTGVSHTYVEGVIRTAKTDLGGTNHLIST